MARGKWLQRKERRSRMKARYVVINDDHRNWFEKEFQLPYGYSNCFISFDFNEVMERCRMKPTNGFNSSWVVEKIDEFGKEIVYRQ